MQHGNEDTYREMLRIKRSVSASYSHTHFILTENMMQRDKMVDVEEAKDELKKAGLPDDEMAALERQLMAAPVSTTVGGRRVGFVSAGVISQSGENEWLKILSFRKRVMMIMRMSLMVEDRVEIAKKEVPAAVFGGLARKREEEEAEEGGEKTLGALERIKRQKLAQ